jgi:hypothetical protein
MNSRLGYLHTKESYKKYIVFIAVSFLLLVVLNVTARLYSPFAEWYATTIYPIIVNIMSRITSIFPFSVVEILIYLIIIGVIYKIIIFIKNLFTKRHKDTKNIKKRILKVICIICSIALTFTLTTGINYHRYTFSRNSGLIIRDSTLEELYELCEDLIRRATSISEEVKVDKNGLTVIDVDISSTARRAMRNIGTEYKDLSGYYPNVKPIFASRLMSYTQIVGVYSPLTVEANYDNDVPAYDIPSTVCHELSHLKGFMREDEANFIAYLACMASDSPAFQYSGIVSAITYSMNALYDAGGKEEYWALYDTLPEQIIRDWTSSITYWKQFRGPVADATEVINNTYLKANAQTDGTRSYGRVVDLLLAEYQSKKK